MYDTTYLISIPREESELIRGIKYLIPMTDGFDQTFNKETNSIDFTLLASRKDMEIMKKLINKLERK